MTQKPETRLENYDDEVLKEGANRIQEVVSL